MALKTDVYALYLARGDSRIPWYAKALAACIVAYAFSPVDLIPDFIPVLGYLDDIILIPLGIAVVIKMIPKAVIEEYRSKAEDALVRKGPRNWFAAGIVILIWVLLATFVIVVVGRTVTG